MRDKASTENRIASELNQAKNVHILQADVTDYAALKGGELLWPQIPSRPSANVTQQASVDEVIKITGGSLDFIIGNAGVAPQSSAFDPFGVL